jgi:putative acetyltransferase
MLTVRDLRRDEARTFLEVHHAAVRGHAAKDYSSEIIDDWAPLPITAQHVERCHLNLDQEIRLVAQRGTDILGVGALVVATSELRACYVSAHAARQGVGTALVRAIEQLARANGLDHLQLDASITAEAFYRSLGYSVVQRTEHIRASGLRMPCIKMRKPMSA